MSWPEPRPGLVIRYSYLWHREALAGRDEGIKDRPCAIIMAILAEGEERRVYVVPVTHSQPSPPDAGIELPAVVKARLQLDGDRSWIVISEANAFVWPGPDLRMHPSRGPESIAYGFLPPSFFAHVRQLFVARARTRKISLVPRTE